ncbi:unnamed protein product [Cuscuta epithymum]|uniref:Uncharacterized protein n=1 Tax=Cuscuta epithymum TaxID=186058 RepID=A0AAV0DWX7_9ASTE|nr:unnamed protein product [Cuscuta epithymum]CAH9135472.1 unnamed protein product [Cuscuta epithymum]
MKSLLSKGAKVDFVNSDFSTSLGHAALCGQPDACRLLLENGANPNGHPDYKSFSPLGLAIRSCSLPCVQLLVEANATLNSPATSWGGNPLHQAAFFGHQEIVKYLLENGADPNIKCVTRFSDDDVWIPRKPIQVAAQYGKVGVVKVLFPHTTPIDGYAEWSIDRILGDMQPGSMRKGGGTWKRKKKRQSREDA